MSAHKTRNQRIVPSGKVYRQKFDAEVQLVKAWENVKQGADEDLDMPAMGQKKSNSIPIVHESRTVYGAGILNERQKNWTYAFPYESSIENPVLYRHGAVAQNERQMLKEESLPSKDVRGLPDVIIPAKIGSDIVTRITESRKQRHEVALEDMKQELAVLNSNLEPEITEPCKLLVSQLGQIEERKALLLSELIDDEQLGRMSLKQLEKVWAGIVTESTSCRQLICELDGKLAEIEDRRMAQIREIFARYAKDFDKIAFLSASEQHTMLDQESQKVNEMLLSNKRMYADLYARLLMADIEHEKQMHTYWKKRVEEWRRLNVNTAVADFKTFMNDPSVKEPAAVDAVMTRLIDAQASLIEQRTNCIDTLRTLKPPALTKASIHNWYRQMCDITKHIDDVNQDHFKQLHQQYERACQLCLDKAKLIKTDLIERSVCSEKAANQVLTEQCLPLIGQLQQQFEANMEQIDKTMEQQHKVVSQRLKHLFKHCQGAAHLWDVHEIGLARQERALQEKLDDSRRKYDRINQDREAALDIQMDRLRQEKSEATLKDSLKKVQDMISKMKAGTEAFGREQLVIIHAYPAMVSEECQRYEIGQCSYFNIRRADQVDEQSEQEVETPEPEKEKEGDVESSQPADETVTKEPGVLLTELQEDVTATGGDAKADGENKTPVSKQRKPEKKKRQLEKVVTSQGTVFVVMEHSAAGPTGVIGDVSTSADEQNGDIDGDTAADISVSMSAVNTVDLPDYAKNIDIGDALVDELKHILRLNVLDHMELWLSDSQHRSHDVVATKVDELNNALDLSFHLHEPRAKRAELDVHNVRAAELVLHSERVSRHCKGCTEALVNLREQFTRLSDDVGKLITKYREDIQGMESMYVKVNKPSIMETMTTRLLREQEKCMSVVRAMLREFHNNLNRTLQTLRESNSRFMMSFRLFSEGGNFCPEEAEEYRKRLQKMMKKIDQMEGVILCDLEGMEAKNFEETAKICQEFEDRFKSQMTDLKFIELVTRRLTNAQVKIKAEVAESNMQSQVISQTVAELERHIDACEHPNLDKVTVSPSQLCESLDQLYNLIAHRVTNLNCLKDPAKLQTQMSVRIASPSDTSVSTGGKTAATAENGNQASRAGRPSNEDATVSVIRDILQSQKNKFATTDLQPELPVASGRDTPRKSRTSKTADEHGRTTNRGRKSLSPLKANASHTEDGKTRSVSAGRRQGKIDKKYFVFGEDPEEGEDSHILGRIKRLLRETDIALLIDGEAYYKQKGNRAVTRPRLLQDNFDAFCEAVVEKLQSYQKQAQEYHNHCLTELRDQLDKVEEVVALIPPLVIREYLSTATLTLEQDKQRADGEFDVKLLELEKIRAQHEARLKPSLGHPQQEAALTRLCEQEEARWEELRESIQRHAQQQKELVVQHAGQFLKELSQKAESLLILFDGLITVDDVQRGNAPAGRHSTVELLRRRQAGKPLEDDLDKEKIARGKMTWPGLSRTDILPVGDQAVRASSSKSTKKLRKTESDEMGRVTTSKTTLGHQATVESRNKSYQEYKGVIASTLATIDETCNQHKQEITRWTQCWNTSVNKIKRLF